MVKWFVHLWGIVTKKALAPCYHLVVGGWGGSQNWYLHPPLSWASFPCYSDVQRLKTGSRKKLKPYFSINRWSKCVGLYVYKKGKSGAVFLNHPPPPHCNVQVQHVPRAQGERSPPLIYPNSTCPTEHGEVIQRLCNSVIFSWLCHLLVVWLWPIYSCLRSVIWKPGWWWWCSYSCAAKIKWVHMCKALRTAAGTW